MCTTVEELADRLGSLVGTLDPSSMGADAAARAVDLFARVERLASAGRTVAAGRAAVLGAHRRAGHRTAAEWLAARTKTKLSDAIATIETAHSLSSSPATREAFVGGALSAAQASEIAPAVAADPAAEASLLELAQRESVKALSERCREVRAAALGDESAAERIRAGRYLRHWRDREGAVRLEGRLAPDDGARLLAVVEARAAELVDEARRSGTKEKAEAHAADALVALACGDSVSSVVYVHVDASALERGSLEPGEVSAIEGVGPVPVAVARRLAREGFLKVIGEDGADVTRVVHVGRMMPARVRSAVEARDVTCVVPDCDRRNGLEIDHIIPVEAGGPTSVENLARLCRFHHAMKTHHGWVLGGRPGGWTWTRPGRDPPSDG